MKHFYAALFIIGLFGLYISAGVAEVQPLLPCAIAATICTVAAGIGSIGYNHTEKLSSGNTQVKTSIHDIKRPIYDIRAHKNSKSH